MHPTFEKMLINYLLAAVRQRTERPENRSKPDWVPSRIRLLTTVRSFDRKATVEPGEYDCETNVWGAIVVIDATGQRLGVHLHECDILGLRPNRKKQSDEAKQVPVETPP